MCVLVAGSACCMQRECCSACCRHRVLQDERGAADLSMIIKTTQTIPLSNILKNWGTLTHHKVDVRHLRLPRPCSRRAACSSGAACTAHIHEHAHAHTYTCTCTCTCTCHMCMCMCMSSTCTVRVLHPASHPRTETCACTCMHKKRRQHAAVSMRPALEVPRVIKG